MCKTIIVEIDNVTGRVFGWCKFAKYNGAKFSKEEKMNITDVTK